MADPICRWRNPSIKQIMEFNTLFPLSNTNKKIARELVEKRWNILGGADFFSAPYQLAAQMGIYYEDYQNMYPKFSKYISLEEAQLYMRNWGKKYYAPNPYTKSLQQTEKPIIINNFLVNWCLENEQAKFSEALQAMFVESIGNTDILVNMLNNFSEVSIDNDIMTLKENAPETPYDTVFLEIDKNDKKYFFDFVTSDFNADFINVVKDSERKRPLQQIFYGAPGTGKSHEIDGQTNDDNSIRTTFHPDTDYATFVGAYKPMMDTVEEYALDATGKTHKIDNPNGKSSIIYKYEPQVFLKAYVEAWKRYLNKQEGEDDGYYLVIEEINRGNCAQIFGDLFQLLDRGNDGYSSYAISPESAITKYLAEEAQSADGTKFSGLEFSDVTKVRDGAKKIIATAGDLKAGKRLVLPPNLHIWATMNTSDQSLFPIDSAFKRRWDWKYMPIKYDNNDWKIVLGDMEYSWTAFQKEINKRIYDATNSEDKQMGDWFVRAEANKISESLLLNKIVFYLWNDVCKDGEGDIFNIKTPDSKTEPIIFSKFFDGTTTEKLQQWMDYLKVTPDTDNQENDADQTDATTETENE